MFLSDEGRDSQANPKRILELFWAKDLAESFDLTKWYFMEDFIRFVGSNNH